MTFEDIVNWITSLIVGYALDFFNWVDRTAYTHGIPWTMMKNLIDDWAYKLRMFVDHLYFEVVELGTSLFEAVVWIFTEPIEHIIWSFQDHWQAISMLVSTFEEWVWTWVNTWFRRLDWLTASWWTKENKIFEEVWEKFSYSHDTDWLKTAWFIVDRFDDLFDTFELHIDGWKTFIDDPAQALWDWIAPRVRELVAGFLVDVW